MAEYPALPLWTDAYLGDTTHLTTLEHGAYLLLLMAMWRAGGRLPNDDARLARYTRLTPGQWQRIKPTLIEFFTVSKNEITQGRLTDELDAVKRKSKRQSDKSKARWLKKQQPADAAAMPDACRTDASLTLTHIHREEPNGSSQTRARELEAEFDEWWKGYPHKVGKGQALKAFKGARRKAELGTLVEGVRRYVTTKPPDRQWCNPATWLNGERWLDEEAPVQARDSPKHYNDHGTQSGLSPTLERMLIDDEFGGVGSESGGEDRDCHVGAALYGAGSDYDGRH